MSASDTTKKYLDRLNQSRNRLWLLGTLSFLETIIVPIPIDLVLIPFMAMNRERIWRIAAVAMAGCVLGAIVGYGVGHVLFQSVGEWFITSFGHEQTYESYRSFFDEYGFVAVLAVGILPIPFQLAMITAGLAGYSLLLFLLATFLARGIRYFGLAFLVQRYGREAKAMWQKHAVMTSVGAGAAVLGIALFTRVESQDPTALIGLPLIWLAGALRRNGFEVP